MSRDPVLRFTDSAGNGYVGLDVVDAENLAELLGVVLDVLCSLAHYENLADYLPARLDRITDELADHLCLVRHFLRPQEEQ
jgi:hypothetical protein